MISMHTMYAYYFRKDSTIIMDWDTERRTTGNVQLLHSKYAKFKGEEGTLVHFKDGLYEWSNEEKQYISRHRKY